MKGIWEVSPSGKVSHSPTEGQVSGKRLTQEESGMPGQTSAFTLEANGTSGVL